MKQNDNLETRIRVAISALEDCNEYFADEPSEDVGGDGRILSLRQDALSARSGLHAALRSLHTPSGAVVEAATELLRLKDEDTRLKVIEREEGNSAAFMDRQDYQRAKGPAWEALRAALSNLTKNIEP